MDEVASKSGFLSMYMSNHRDTLVAYCMHYGKVKRAVNAKMDSISSDSMIISYLPYRDASEPKTVTIPFEPRLQSYDEARPRLLAMKAEAEQALRMDTVPVVDSFRLGRLVPFIMTLVTFLVACTVMEDHEFGGRIRNAAGGMRTIVAAWIFAISCHIAEAYYQYTLCRKHKTGVRNTFLWVFLTFLLGVAGFSEFKRIVKERKIASLSKSQ
ncbi:uncharacterized protein L969DRAFT_85174 [Mixia osmundae IAM 14324]|uniref:uncharacterized protein n=1 Tax=Mixia osmundae (strain CBS 9802 / IAM 14324 / JCM 22182 / KY 12970) TaxID=764103 RepID=UPI0004A54951|nr:uncharacterized protein L969DRAFT_85174 [Mixia osmundae IAM 14324]KEI41403.1 hypothetical protein L969DRAFT_85174 [Mixia osmundae IAM 14324]